MTTSGLDADVPRPVTELYDRPQTVAPADGEIGVGEESTMTVSDEVSRAGSLRHISRLLL